MVITRCATSYRGLLITELAALATTNRAELLLHAPSAAAYPTSQRAGAWSFSFLAWPPLPTPATSKDLCFFFAPNLSLPVSVAASPQWSTSAPCPSGSGTCARRQRKLRRPSPSAWPRYVSAPHVCRHVSAPVRRCVVSRSPTGRPLTPACGGSIRVVRAGPLDGGAVSPRPVHHSCRKKLSTNGYPWLSLLCCPLPPCPPPPTGAARSV